MGKKQYNYHKDYSFAKSESDYENCKVENFATTSNPPEPSEIFSICQNPLITSNVHSGKECKYLYYHDNEDSNGIDNKYVYDKWVTSIIFGCFIIALNIGLALFGFLLFKQTDGQSGPVTLR